MFNTLQVGFTKLFQKLTGITRLTPVIIDPLLKELEENLLNADVALAAVNELVNNLRSELLQSEGDKHLNAEQLFIKLVHKNLTKLLGKDKAHFQLHSGALSVILLIGLQGSGKTTTAAKLALRLKNEGKKVRLASVDFYRPAAVEQLKQLARQIDIPFSEIATIPSSPTSRDVLTASWQAFEQACQEEEEVLILDTAGRLHVDSELMSELEALQKQLRPSEILLVADSMLGQDAAISAQQFKQNLPISGAILTKLDGDSRGGAALSLVKVANIRIKFVGTGEKPKDLEIFHPNRMAERILGMGDMLSLIESIEEDVQKQLLEKLQGKQSFSLNDFALQLEQIDKMGGINTVLEKMPSSLQMNGLAHQFKQKDLNRMKALLCSMTPKERRNPALLKASRKQRIAKGAGSTVQALNQLLQQFEMQRTFMSRFSKLGVHGLLKELQRLMR